MDNYLCFDIGGTTVKYGVLQPPNGLVMTGEIPTRGGGPGILRTLKAAGAELKNRYPAAGVCLSTAGVVDCDGGVILHASDLIPGYSGIRLKEEIEEYFHLPCEMENDVNCAGLAEVHAGAAKGCSAAVCLTVGTGIGGAFLLDGRVFRGAFGSACEVGYMHLPGGEFQDLAAASVLVSKIEQARGLEPGTIDGRWVFDHADGEDELCLQAIENMADILAMGIANICYVLNPEIVVLGGGIMARSDRVLPLIRLSMKKYLIPAVEQKTRVEAALNGNQAGMLGAWYHFCQRRGIQIIR